MSLESRVCSHCGEVCRDVWDLAAHLAVDHEYGVGGAALALGLLDDADGAWERVTP